ncbi:MAG: hypothetical protein CSA96_00505 [Bacteroidetes bacterium]|nr:MAG: hypothetical protein CSA96_00505 [Bacteroidota bacterium]
MLRSERTISRVRRFSQFSLRGVFCERKGLVIAVTFVSLVSIFFIFHRGSFFFHHIFEQSDLDSEQKDRSGFSSLPPIILGEGKAIVKGHVYGYDHDAKGQIRIGLMNPIMNEPGSRLADIADNGDFYLEIPLISNSSVLFISDYYSEYIVLSPEDTCYIDIDAKKVTGIQEFDVIERSTIDSQYVRFRGAFSKVNSELNDIRFWFNTRKLKCEGEYENSAVLKRQILSRLEDLLKELHSTNISDATKELVTINLQQLAIRCLLWDYSLLGNHTKNGDLTTAVVDMGYFDFLKEMSINVPNSFYGRLYGDCIWLCMDIEKYTFPFEKIVELNSRPVKVLSYDDLLRQKDFLARVLGEHEGPAFDLLTVLNFTSLLRSDLPLNDWQIAELVKLEEPVYHDYIVRRNESLDSMLNSLREKPLSRLIDATEKEVDFFESILSQYKGNVILIDLWSMGCIPCIQAIDFIESKKEKYKDRNVKFIYLSDDHFDYTFWENKSIQIEGIHYRLNQNQIDFLQSKYGMGEAVPHFLLLDIEGNCIINQKGYLKPVMENILSIIDQEISKTKQGTLVVE